MNVTVVCDVLGRANNGTTIAALNLINSLYKKGHNVKVVCPDKDKKGMSNYYILPKFNFGNLLNNYVEKNGVSIAKPDENVLTEAICGADVVHVMTPFFVGTKAVKIAIEMGIPITAGFHCQAENLTSHLFLMNSKFANRETYRVFYKTVYRYCACIHYPTQFICDVFENTLDIKTNHYIISNGVGAEFKKHSAVRPDELKGKIVILFTGRFSKEKSHIVLIDAIKKSTHKDSIQLVFAGDGPLKDKLEEYSADLPNKPIFRFFTRAELIDVINYSDLYVHPAEIEIEAIACLEAITCGLVPVIANSPRCATKHFAIDERNLFAYNDSDDLARKIDYWLDNPNEKAKRSQEYLGYAKQFEFGACMDRMEEMLKDAIKIGAYKKNEND